MTLPLNPFSGFVFAYIYWYINLFIRIIIQRKTIKKTRLLVQCFVVVYSVEEL